MPIPETQLDTWSKVGSQTQSKDTYATIRNALDVATAPYTGNIEIFLQGSYGNDTNVYGKDSDVDIVMRSDRAYFRDLSRLTPEEKAAYAAVNGGTADYPLSRTPVDLGGSATPGIACTTGLASYSGSSQVCRTARFPLRSGTRSRMTGLSERSCAPQPRKP